MPVSAGDDILRLRAIAPGAGLLVCLSPAVRACQIRVPGQRYPSRLEYIYKIIRIMIHFSLTQCLVRALAGYNFFPHSSLLTLSAGTRGFARMGPFAGLGRV